MDMVGVVAIVSTFLFSAFVVKVIFDVYSVKRRSSLSEKFMDKLGSAGEISEFLKSGKGNEFISSMMSQQENSKQKLINSFHRSIIVLFVGIGIILIQNESVFDYDIKAFGILVLSLGAGMLVASIVSYIMARNWNLLNGK
ncbi:MAG: hypothetical protein JW737_02670 [Acidobacteria bacterium]|nr:hypothetical protein [Acidobacteriota bacterium]